MPRGQVCLPRHPAWRPLKLQPPPPLLFFPISCFLPGLDIQLLTLCPIPHDPALAQMPCLSFQVLVLDDSLPLSTCIWLSLSKPSLMTDTGLGMGDTQLNKTYSLPSGTQLSGQCHEKKLDGRLSSAWDDIDI